jgi:hypothetical protein
LKNLKEHVYALAADSMQGRETGEPGSIMAGNYIERFFIDIGVPAIGDTTYRQTMSFTWLRWEENELFVDGAELRNMRDYLAVPADNYSMDSLRIDEVIFAGYGILDENYTDIPDVDLNGKVVVVLSGEPFDKDGNSKVSGLPEASKWSDSDSLKVATMAERGAKLILMAQPTIGSVARANWNRLARPIAEGSPVEPEEGVPGLIYFGEGNVLEMLGELGEELRAVIDTNKAKAGILSGRMAEVDLHINLKKSFETLEDDNILGYIPGIDPDRSDELIVVSAHYDHIGYEGDEIFSGANDNASGTSAVMEMGRALMAARENGDGPARSVLLLLLTGEEIGLLGSLYYVQNPVFPLENTIANINIDMLGRVDDKHREKGIENYIYPIGTDRLSTEFHEIVLEVNEKYSNIHLDFTYNDPSDPNRYYFRSDHYNFARNGIPAVFYFNGMNEDYHLPTDTPDKMNFESMTAVTRHIFHVVWELANREEAIQVDVFED